MMDTVWQDHAMLSRKRSSSESTNLGIDIEDCANCGLALRFLANQPWLVQADTRELIYSPSPTRVTRLHTSGILIRAFAGVD